VNDESGRVENNAIRSLKNGDILKFGIPVSRGSDSFPPTSVKVDFVFNEQ
jgi:hypothetical protein